MDRLKGKVAVVFGAGPNIGGTIAHFLGREGARVVVCDIGASLQGEGSDTGPAQDTVNAIKKAGGEAIASTMSITEPKNAEVIVKNAFDAQVAFEGIWEIREGYDVPDCAGCETGIYVPFTGQTQFVPPPDCNPDGPIVSISPGQIAWFNFDCNFCTGVYDHATGLGYFHKIWNASAPPPNPPAAR